ncbi:hypothetical protein [Pseudoalteromonas sp.]|uniref:tetratricopeptide repeat protein n=1 Tax=Pseudoalteromonas sp. TaxID=53249 RepID=UPI0023560F72|nr:hypothetical protein [Pseudoalteromonas sp.]
MDTISKEHTEKLLQFWHQDKSNEQLFLDLLSSIARTESYDLIAQVNDNAVLTSCTSINIHASFIQLLITSRDHTATAVYLDKYSAYLGVWKLYFQALSAFIECNFDTVIELLSGEVLESEVAYDCALILARTQYITGDINSAVRELTPFVKAGRNSGAAGLYALCNFDLGNYPLSHEWANIALENDKHNIDAILALASYFVITQELSAAEEAISHCLQLNPTLGRAWSLQGQLNLYRGDIASALQSFSSATTYMPDHIGTWHLFAWTQLFSNELGQAEAAFSKAVNLNPSFSESHGGLAIVEIQKENVDGAKKLIKLALRLDSGCFTARYAQSLLLEREGSLDEASQLVESILQSESYIDSISYKQLVQNALLNMANKD